MTDRPVITGNLTAVFNDTELQEAYLEPRTINVLAMHQDERDVFVPTAEQQAAIDAGDLIIATIKYAASMEDIPGG